MDKIILSGVEVFAYGGVKEAERLLGQRYRIDVELGVDLHIAARSDQLEDSVSYADIHGEVVAAMRARPFQLIEHAAGRIADVVLQRFPVAWVSVRVTKLLPPIDGIVASAAVEIVRSRASP